MTMLERKTVSQCISSDYCKGWNDAVDAMPVRHGWWEADVWSSAEKRVIKTVPLTEENMRKYAFRKPFDRYLTHQRCSVCGEDPLANFNEEYEFSKYCPNCGAKMDAEVEEDA